MQYYQSIARQMFDWDEKTILDVRYPDQLHRKQMVVSLMFVYIRKHYVMPLRFYTYCKHVKKDNYAVNLPFVH